VSSFKNNKQVISGNDAAGPPLPTNAVSVMQHPFWFQPLIRQKEADILVAFDQVWKLKFTFDKCTF